MESNESQPGQDERRQRGAQFGRGTGAFSQTVNITFALLRKIETDKKILTTKESN